jgi:hypothetical protein
MPCPVSTAATSTGCCEVADGAALVFIGDALACAEDADAVDEAGCASGFAAASSPPKILDMIELKTLIR